MNLETWMAGTNARAVELDRPPRIVPGRQGPWEVHVARKGGRHYVGVMRVEFDWTPEENARQRFLSWYAITGERGDTIPTAEVRRDWRLAHADQGVRLPASEGKAGVDALLEIGAVRGRGLLRCVTRTDDLLDEAEALVRDVLC